MSKHTPGPWQFNLHRDSDDFDICTIDVDADDSGRPVNYGHSIIEGTFTSGATGEIEANARLIAASPDLLEALETVYGLLLERNPGFFTIALDNKIRSALAAAREGTS